ncbi:hypothetical protein M405DRAFT_865550 [Rhizopogon salebrosus TDB-379]|nr:hypothetical protein M405DRAFT_865550 [Rhizopogon salebrosus TDB-379]
MDVDVDVPEIVPHLHRRKSPKLQSRFRSRSPVISLTSGSNPEDGDSDSDGGDSESDGMIDDARIDAWGRSRRPTREKSLIDWMLTRTRTVGGGRKKRSNELGKNAIGPPAHISLVDDESHETHVKLSKSGVGLRMGKESQPAKGGKLPVGTYVGEGRKLLKENGDYEIHRLLRSATHNR